MKCHLMFKWEKKFKEIDGPCEFTRITLADGSKIFVTMLVSTNRDFDYAKNDQFTTISIPYSEKDYNFVIILPNTKDGYKIFKKIAYHKFNKYLLSQMCKKKN